MRIGSVSVGGAALGWGGYYMYLGAQCYASAQPGESVQACTRRSITGGAFVILGAGLFGTGLLFKNSDKVKSFFCTQLPDVFRRCGGRTEAQGGSISC